MTGFSKIIRMPPLRKVVKEVLYIISNRKYHYCHFSPWKIHLSRDMLFIFLMPIETH